MLVLTSEDCAEELLVIDGVGEDFETVLGFCWEDWSVNFSSEDELVNELALALCGELTLASDDEEFDFCGDWLLDFGAEAFDFCSDWSVDNEELLASLFGEALVSEEELCTEDALLALFGEAFKTEEF